MIRTKSITSHEFDQYAGDYDRMLAEGLVVSGEEKDYFALRRIQWVKACMDKLQLAPRRFMDYGCGRGEAAPLLLGQFNAESVVGVDPSAKLIELAKHEHTSRRIIFQLTQEYCPEEERELVYCNGVFHHIPVAERKMAAQYIWRSLEPGGCLAFWENNSWNPGTRYVMSRIPFDRDAVTLTAPEATRLLQSAGFHIVRTDYLFIFPKSLSVLRWMEPHLSPYPFGAQYLVLGRKAGRLSNRA
ncbi:MAG: methyltransferase domain-containing protein [Nitrospira sp.]|nr:methyltransferase domain-containing protein [Nitrospira sp.]